MTSTFLEEIEEKIVTTNVKVSALLSCGCYFVIKFGQKTKFFQTITVNGKQFSWIDVFGFFFCHEIRELASNKSSLIRKHADNILFIIIIFVWKITYRSKWLESKCGAFVHVDRLMKWIYTEIEYIYQIKSIGIFSFQSNISLAAYLAPTHLPSHTLCLSCHSNFSIRSLV